MIDAQPVVLLGDEVSWHLYAACQWLADGVRARLGASACLEVVGATAARTPVDAVLDGTVDVALTTPIAAGTMAYEGRGMYDAPQPSLRAIGALPHRDRLALAVAVDVAERDGLVEFADLTRRRPPLRMIASLDVHRSPQAFGTDALLRRHGLVWSDLTDWGGEWLPYRGPARAAEQIRAGEADGLVHDAIMLWHEFAVARPMRLLPIERRLLDDLERDVGLVATRVGAGEYDGIDGSGAVLDWSQWLIVCRDDLPAAVAGALAQTLVEDRAAFEALYRHLPRHQSPLHYPIVAVDAARTGSLPLHPGAAQYFDEQRSKS